VVKKSAKKERKDAINRSRAVLSGQMLEQVAPFLPDFPCNPADVRFVGKPIDFVAFPGASENKEIKEVVFIEVKTGNSVLSPREKEIKDAIQQGRVRYVEYRFDESLGTC
jgi:predicted Holliday junction resolvase-like endonuclease